MSDSHSEAHIVRLVGPLFTKVAACHQNLVCEPSVNESINGMDLLSWASVLLKLYCFRLRE